MYSIEYAVDVADDEPQRRLIKKAPLAIASEACLGREAILDDLGRSSYERSLCGRLVTAAAGGFHAAAINRRAAVAVTAVMEKVMQPAVTTTTARITRITASRFRHAASRFRHAAGGLGSAAGRLTAAGHVPAAAKGLRILAEARDRAGDQQQREQNLGFHSGGSPRGSRINLRDRLRQGCAPTPAVRAIEGIVQALPAT